MNGQESLTRFFEQHHLSVCSSRWTGPLATSLIMEYVPPIFSGVWPDNITKLSTWRMFVLSVTSIQLSFHWLSSWNRVMNGKSQTEKGTVRGTLLICQQHRKVCLANDSDKVLQMLNVKNLQRSRFSHLVMNQAKMHLFIRKPIDVLTSKFVYSSPLAIELLFLQGPHVRTNQWKHNQWNFEQVVT